MEKREFEIAAVAAAVATGCIRCLDYHNKIALASGITENELLEIATISLRVRDKADEFNRGDLDAVLNGSSKPPKPSEEVPQGCEAAGRR